MKTIQGPALFIAQFIGNEPPFNTLEGIAAWAAGLGFKGLQLPSNDPRFLDLKTAAESKGYCDELLGKLQNLVGSQRTIVALEHVANLTALLGSAAKRLCRFQGDGRRHGGMMSVDGLT